MFCSKSKNIVNSFKPRGYLKPLFRAIFTIKSQFTSLHHFGSAFFWIIVWKYRTVKIKLTKKHDQPCLTFDMDLTPSLSNSETTVLNPAMAHSRQCVHDVPVNVLPRRLWSDYNEPAMTKPDIRWSTFSVAICIYSTNCSGKLKEYKDKIKQKISRGFPFFF